MNERMPSARLGDVDVAVVTLGQSPPSSTYNTEGRGLPFFQGKADFGLLHPVPRTWCIAGQKFARPGDVVMSVRAPVGDVNIATEDCVIGRGVAAIRAGNRTDPWFLYFALLHSKPVLESRASGTTFASINRATLMDLEIPLPSKRDQRAIAHLLREVVQRVVEEQALVVRAQALKRAAMRVLFTKGLRGEAQKQTEIGPVPESWEVTELGKHIRHPDYGYAACAISEPTGPRFLRITDIQNGRVNWDALPFCACDEKIKKDKMLKYGDIVVARIGATTGKAFLIQDDPQKQYLHRI
ncbi:MAG: restriction endonuclease subunit S [Geminicoccaceae bacterium]|nr:restriction endonuclease subunit S [Geminicoccaceae bacterium]